MLGNVMTNYCDWDYVSDVVDDFVSDIKSARTTPSQFWEQMHSNQQAQQIYAQCLIFKYISFTYGLGHKPLREAIRVIKNVSNFPGSNNKKTVEISGPSTTPTKVAIPRRQSVALGVSPHKRQRAQTMPDRRPSAGDHKTPAGRNSIGESGSRMNDPNRRKASDGLVELSSAIIEEMQMMKTLRDLMYTLSYMLNTCTINQWDFSNLREVFLIWNKARGWDQDPNGYESLVMKRFSRPPDERNEEEKWKSLFTEILIAFVDCNGEKSHSLEDSKVGNSLKYWAVLHEICRNSASVHLIIDALSEVAGKVYTSTEENKVMPLLHIICDTIITAPHVPLASLEKIYASIQMFYLWAKPISSAVKEVLDLIQTEMKSPGYYCRVIFCQEQDLHDPSREADVYTPSSVVNLMVDSRLPRCRSMAGTFRTISSGQEKREHKRFRYQCLLIEHIYQAVFGPDCCDLSSLRQALEACPATTVSSVCTEALSLMEQSLSVDDYSQAHESARQQLDALSNQLADDAEGIDWSQQLDSQDSDCAEQSLKSDSSSNSLQSFSGSLVHPPRNRSYLSRTASNTSMVKAPQLNSQVSLACSHAVDSMRHASIQVEPYDPRQLPETLYQLVRASAKDFLIEKRKSGSFTFARQRYLSRQRSLIRQMSDPRDSGVIEDYAETNDGHVNKHLTISKSLDQHHEAQSPIASSPKLPHQDSTDSQRLWLQFLERGFEVQESGDSDIDNLLKDMSLDIPLTPTASSDHDGDDTSFFQPSRDETAASKTNADVKEEAEAEIDHAVSEVLASFDFANEELEAVTEESGKDQDSKNKHGKKKSKGSKNKFKTLKRAKKLVRGAVKRSASTRVPTSPPPAERDGNSQHKNDDSSSKTNDDDDSKSDKTSVSSNSSSTPVSTAAMALFDAVSTSRWRTLSDPLRTRKSHKRSKYSHITDIFHSSGDINRGANSSFSFPMIPPDDSASTYSGLNMTVPGQFTDTPTLSISNHLDTLPKRLSIPTGKSGAANGSPVEDDEARNRIDSGVVLEKSAERPRYQKMSSLPNGADWEGSGVAGVKISRKLAVRKNRKSRSSLSFLLGRTLRRKVLKLMFVGNDRTISDLARAYYDLRRRQMTRAPLLNHIDLRLFYIPIGENAFEDERPPGSGEQTNFDLQIGEMLGRTDPWYHRSVSMTFNNLLRVCPKMTEDDYDLDQVNGDREKFIKSSLLPETIISNSLARYSRFAVTTQHIPIFKATMRRSTNETISEVFCCGVEIGSVAYKQAIKEGRFGKLVDLSNDSGPPEIYTTFEYAKFGLNGVFRSSTRHEETFYRSVSMSPVTLTNDNIEGQKAYTGADSMQVTLIENDKVVKSLKRGLRKGQSEEEGLEVPKTKLLVSAAKLEVVRPQQGTFTVWLDQSLIFTNVKSIEVSRCLAPEYERSNFPKRKHSRAPPRFLSLPVKTFWPSSHSY